MKTKVMILLSAIFLSNLAVALEKPKLKVAMVAEKQVLVEFSAPSASRLKLTVTNNENRVVYESWSDEATCAFQRELDVSTLKDGVYQICLNYGGKSVNRRVDVNNGGFNVGYPKHCFEPFLNVKGQMLNVSFLNIAGKNVFLNIYQNGKYVAGLKLGNDTAIHKSLDLSHLKKGNYTVVVSEKLKKHCCEIAI